MSNNITTLVLNLIIAESFMHRQNIADRIREILNKEQEENPLEAAVRKLLLRKLKMYTENPTREAKDLVYEIAEFYCEYFRRMPAPAMQMAA